MQKMIAKLILSSTRSSVGALTMPELHTTKHPSGGDSNGTSFPTRLALMVLVPLVLLAGLTTICYWTPLDLIATRQFFSAGHNPFPFRETLLANLIYDYGPIPAIALFVVSAITLLLSFVVRLLRPARKGALFCTLAILIGPGILINSVLKPNWGRPRPCDIVAFGGTQNYVPPGTIGPYEMAKSFPSGHASMGFVFMLPAFLLLGKRNKAAMALFAVGFLLGAGVGASRIAEGGHFLSDIAWSGAIVYFTGLASYLAIYGWDHAAPSAEKQLETPVDTIPFARNSREAEPRKTSAA